MRITPDGEGPSVLALPIDFDALHGVLSPGPCGCHFTFLAIVVDVRRHVQTENLLFGSVSHDAGCSYNAAFLVLDRGNCKGDVDCLSVFSHPHGLTTHHAVTSH